MNWIDRLFTAGKSGTDVDYSDSMPAGHINSCEGRGRMSWQ